MTAGAGAFYVALTVDVDPDANRACAGRPDAVSAGVPGGRVSLKGCRAGLETLAAVLEEMRIPCTFFWEARSLSRLSTDAPEVVGRLAHNAAFEHGCHGLRHEDFSGRDTGLAIGAGETLAILREASHTCAAITGSRPAGFRAPYCRWTAAMGPALRELGYAYDASHTRTAGSRWALRPYPLSIGPGEGQLWELALCRSRDGSGRPVTGYLWSLFEGRRRPGDYVALARSLARQHPGGLLQIALHPWHLVVSERGEPLAGRDPTADLRAVLSGIAALEGTVFLTPGAYLRRYLAGGV